MPAWQVPRSHSGWIPEGKELDPAAVQFCATFKSPMVHFLLMWCGGSRLEDNKVLSCVEYMKMNATTAHGMCAAGQGLHREGVSKTPSEHCSKNLETHLRLAKHTLNVSQRQPRKAPS